MESIDDDYDGDDDSESAIVQQVHREGERKVRRWMFFRGSANERATSGEKEVEEVEATVSLTLSVF